MRVAAGLLALLLCGCATYPGVAGKEAKVTLEPNHGRTATFEYLGSGGWLIRSGNDAVLTAPFFSNPWYLTVFRAAGPNAAAVKTHIEQIEGGVGDVRAVVAGHAHYDHIMDLPEVAKYLPMNAWVLGGDTVCNSLGRNFIRPCVPVTDRAGTRQHPARAFEATETVHIRPYFSEHAAHYWRLKLFGGHVSEMSESVPAKPALWREGETLAYLIDFVRDGKIELRVYYNDAAPSSPFGLPDQATLDQKAVDVAIFTVASFGQQADYPETYLKVMKPKHVLLGHWEDFFTSGKVKPVRGTNVAKFLEALPPTPFTLPDRHTVVTVTY